MSLKGIIERRRGDKLYRYLRRKGQPLVPLPADVPIDHPRFLAAYAAARESDPPPRDPGTLSALIVSALSSDHYKGLSRVYRATLRRHCDAIRMDYGKAMARKIKAGHIEIDLGKAKNTTDRRKAWRFLAGHGRSAGLLSEDPTIGVEAPKRRKTDGHPPWTHAEIEAYRDRWPIGTVARAAMELLFWVGCRLEDSTLIGPGMVDRQGVLVFRQHKTGGMAYVPWSCALPAYAAHMVDDRDMMIKALTALPGRHMTFLATTRGQTRSAPALGTKIRESAQAAGFAKSAHGLRKTRATILSEAGGTTHQIAAWTGHESLKEVEHYTRSAARRAAVMGSEQERNSGNSLQKGGNTR